jgi:hypothetical protein
VPAGLAALPRPKVGATEVGAPTAPPVAPPQETGPAGEGQEGELVGIMEHAMPFVISLFFHLGLILVTVFLGTLLIEKKEAPPGEIIVPGTAMVGDDDTSGGTLTPSERPTIQAAGGGARVSKLNDSSARSTIVAAGGGSGDAHPGMGVIGLGGATGGTGEGTGTGQGKWFGGGGGTGFFGLGMGRGRGGGGLARHIVYVIDRSGSMIDTFDAVKNEMLTSIGQLDPKQDFDIILFTQGAPQEPVDKRLVPATPEYKGAATKFLKDAYAAGSTDPLPALSRAFEVLDKVSDPGGKVVFFLTDSDFPDNDAVVKFCKAHNVKHDVHFFTFLYGGGKGGPPEKAEEAMKTIAKENGGKYKYVTEE